MSSLDKEKYFREARDEFESTIARLNGILLNIEDNFNVIDKDKRVILNIRDRLPIINNYFSGRTYVAHAKPKTKENIETYRSLIDKVESLGESYSKKVKVLGKYAISKNRVPRNQAEAGPSGEPRRLNEARARPLAVANVLPRPQAIGNVANYNEVRKIFGAVKEWKNDKLAIHYRNLPRATNIDPEDLEYPDAVRDASLILSYSNAYIQRIVLTIWNLLTPRQRERFTVAINPIFTFTDGDREYTVGVQPVYMTIRDLLVRNIIAEDLEFALGQYASININIVDGRSVGIRDLFILLDYPKQNNQSDIDDEVIAYNFSTDTKFLNMTQTNSIVSKKCILESVVYAKIMKMYKKLCNDLRKKLDEGLAETIINHYKLNIFDNYKTRENVVKLRILEEFYAILPEGIKETIAKGRLYASLRLLCELYSISIRVFIYQYNEVRIFKEDGSMQWEEITEATESTDYEKKGELSKEERLQQKEDGIWEYDLIYDPRQEHVGTHIYDRKKAFKLRDNINTLAKYLETFEGIHPEFGYHEIDKSSIKFNPRLTSQEMLEEMLEGKEVKYNEELKKFSDDLDEIRWEGEITQKMIKSLYRRIKKEEEKFSNLDLEYILSKLNSCIGLADLIERGYLPVLECPRYEEVTCDGEEMLIPTRKSKERTQIALYVKYETISQGEQKPIGIGLSNGSFFNNMNELAEALVKQYITPYCTKKTRPKEAVEKFEFITYSRHTKDLVYIMSALAEKQLTPTVPPLARGTNDILQFRIGNVSFTDISQKEKCGLADYAKKHLGRDINKKIKNVCVYIAKVIYLAYEKKKEKDVIIIDNRIVNFSHCITSGQEAVVIFKNTLEQGKRYRPPKENIRKDIRKDVTGGIMEVVIPHAKSGRLGKYIYKIDMNSAYANASLNVLPTTSFVKVDVQNGKVDNIIPYYQYCCTYRYENHHPNILVGLRGKDNFGNSVGVLEDNEPKMRSGYKIISEMKRGAVFNYYYYYKCEGETLLKKTVELCDERKVKAKKARDQCIKDSKDWIEHNNEYEQFKDVVVSLIGKLWSGVPECSEYATRQRINALTKTNRILQLKIQDFDEKQQKYFITYKDPFKENLNLGIWAHISKTVVEIHQGLLVDMCELLGFENIIRVQTDSITYFSDVPPEKDSRLVGFMDKYEKGKWKREMGDSEILEVISTGSNSCVYKLADGKEVPYVSGVSDVTANAMESALYGDIVPIEYERKDIVENKLRISKGIRNIKNNLNKRIYGEMYEPSKPK